MDTSTREIFTINKWQDIVLAECAEDFGITMKYNRSDNNKVFYSLHGHTINVSNTISHYFNNIKLGKPLQLTEEEIELKHSQLVSGNIVKVREGIPKKKLKLKM